MISHRAYYVWLRNFTVYKSYIKASMVTNVGEPLLYLFAMGYGIGSFIPEIKGMGYIDYIAPGLIVTAVMYSAVFECTFGSFTRMVVQRTYDSILATPVSVADLVAGELLWGMTKGLISATVILLVMTVFGIYTPGPSLFVILPAMALTGFIFASAALSFSALVPSYEFFNYFFTIFISPMFFLSGVFFPLDKFPTVIKLFSITLPATHAVSLARASFHQLPTPNMSWFSWLFLVSAAFGFGYMSFLLVKRRIIN